MSLLSKLLPKQKQKNPPPSQKPKTNLQSKGKLGEDFAANFLTRKGYRIIARNFHSRYGEIDLIALYRGRLVFIEVKTRSSMQFGTPEEAVNSHKLKAIALTGEYYAQLHPNLPADFQIDVVSILLVGKPIVRHLVNLEVKPSIAGF